MKKIAKLSLVAAVAVAGLTSANAQPLEEAIKGVEVTGSVVYRYNDYRNDTAAGSLYSVSKVASTATDHTHTDADDNKYKVSDLSKQSDTSNNYKVALGLAAKVNEDVKFNSRFLVGNSDGDFASLNTQTDSDANPTVTLSNAYFAYTGIANTTVNVGKQGLTTPWTVAVDSDGSEQTGTGVLALSTVGPVTLAAAYFNQTNLATAGDAKLNGYTMKELTSVASSSTDDYIYAPASVKGILDGSDAVATVGVIGVAGPVTLDAWYLDMDRVFDSYTVGAKAADEISGIKVGADARWASLELDKHLNADGDKNTMAKLVLTADAGLVDGKLAYAMTGKDGGLTALDNDASTTLLGWSLTANGKADADYWQAVLGFDILSNLNLSANYGNLQYIEEAGSDVDVEEEEVYAQLLYKMSKNLTTYVRYGTYTKEASDASSSVDVNDDTRGRIQVEYTF